MIPQQTIDAILSAVHIESYIGNDIELKKEGVNYKGCCPFHNEKTPSFVVSPTKGIFKCFGCQEGGNVIQYVMKRENMTFPEAVKHLARRYNIEFEEREQTPEEREAAFKRESIYVANDAAVKYYAENLKRNKAAMAYVLKRWDEKTVQEMQIGYAGPEWDGFLKTALKGQHKEQTLLEAGLVSRSEKTGGLFDFFRDRIVIPIRSWNGHVVGFTARTFKKDDTGPKYLNTRETAVFSKSRNLFGIFEAMRVAKSTDRINLVEGAPDAIRLQSVGVTNTVAPLGTALTKEQVEQIKRCCKNVVMIPDTDAPGRKAALKNGELLFRSGLNVSVVLLNSGLDPKKKDPDDCIKVRLDYDDALEHNAVDYILWRSAMEMADVSSESEKADVIGKICELLAIHQDESTTDMYIESLSKVYKPKKVWTTKLAEAKNRRDVQSKMGDNKKTDEVFEKFGFIVKNNSYEGPGRGGTVRWSNFIMKPLAHVRSMTNSKRLYMIKNEYGHEQTIEVKQEDLVSLAKFRVRTESMGNYLWEAGEVELHKLKRYLYENTITCDEITQLGWQKKYGFFAWGNGGVIDGQFVKVDDIGILTIRDNHYYLPAFSRVFENDPQLFQFERKFVHIQANGISLYDYAQRLIGVFGDNGKIGLCFLFATLFKDIVTRHTKSFPILNLFGPKGTGKSELGHSLTSFFVPKNVPPNISNTTIPAMAEAVAQVANAVVHLDEYKNTIDLDRREFLKGLWDGAGRTRMNMDRDKKRETTSVDAGVVLSGQEMPTADIALFSRLVFLTFNRAEFSDDERRQFEELKRIEDRGLSHLTNDLLRYRPAMETNYAKEWNECAEEMEKQLENHAIEDRTFKNWVTLVAACRTLAPLIHLPFTVEEVTDIARKGIISQNEQTKQNNELAGFWETLESLVRSVQVVNEVDFKIKVQANPVALRNYSTKVALEADKRYLFLNFNGVVSLYLKECRSTGAKQLPKDSLKYYLENSQEYIGVKKSERFKRLLHQGSTAMASQLNQQDSLTQYQYQVTTCMVFDYEAIVEHYGINIDQVAMTEREAEDE